MTQEVSTEVDLEKTCLLWVRSRTIPRNYLEVKADLRQSSLAVSTCMTLLESIRISLEELEQSLPEVS